MTPFGKRIINMSCVKVIRETGPRDKYNGLYATINFINDSVLDVSTKIEDIEDQINKGTK